MSIAIGDRPPELDGCWTTWDETDVDVVLRTEMEAGNVKTRRRFTGISSQINATVVVRSNLYNAFLHWWRVMQKQGAKATKVIHPDGLEVVVQFTAPPVFKFNVDGTMVVSARFYRASWWT